MTFFSSRLVRKAEASCSALKENGYFSQGLDTGARQLSDFGIMAFRKNIEN